MKKLFPIGSALLFAALLLLHPDKAGAAVREGLALCAATVIPSLFPFFVLTALLLRLGVDSILRPLCAPLMGPLFGLRGVCAAPLLAGFLGGYPTGARSAAQLYEQGALTRAEAQRLLGFCNNCGIGFLVGFVGAGIFSSVSAGIALLVIHILSALLSGFVLCRIAPHADLPRLPGNLPVQNASPGAAFTASVSGAVTATLTVCAYVVFFRTVTALVPMSGVLSGAVEMVGAVTALEKNAAGFAAAAGITAWGGLSVHCQTMAVVGDLSLRYHTAGKLLQTAFAVVLAVVVGRWM
ncbi:MAG: sporulation protein [Oscillospiraceae bacterium]|nr:sporulation protein [Oscillospiraceae bacterium]